MLRAMDRDLGPVSPAVMEETRLEWEAAGS
jgi:hypothetical protein